MTTELALVPVASRELARATIAHHSKSFALASRLLPARTRDDTAIVYAFCRHADDAVDDAASQPAALRALDALRREVDEVYAPAAERPRTPVLAAFAAVAHARAIPRAYPDELLAGMAMDVAGTRYATLDQLVTYAHRVAGVVGLMMCHVFGVRDDAALLPAARLGLAMQLTNICRDVAEDWRRERLYVPDEILARHGAGGLAAELGRPLPTTALAPLAASVRELLAVADAQYRAAEAGIPALPWRAALAVRAARRVYAAIGDELAAAAYDVTAPRAVVPRRKKLALVATATARTLVSLPTRAFATAPRTPTRTLEASDVTLA